MKLIRSKEEILEEMQLLYNMAPEEKLLYRIKNIKSMECGDENYEYFVDNKLDYLIDAILEYLQKENNL